MVGAEVVGESLVLLAGTTTAGIDSGESLGFCWLDYMSSVVVAGAGGWWGSKAVPGGAVFLDYVGLMNSVDFCFDYICWICSFISGTFVGLICWMRAAMMKKIKTSILMTMARQ
ncbi:hypothetical protein Hanom_Chr09g00812001 [Helianthus anomalus]